MISRGDVPFQQKPGYVALDQVRTVDRERLIKRLGALPRDGGRSYKRMEGAGVTTS